MLLPHQKEKTETTEEYLFWIILGIIGTIISAIFLIKRKKIVAQIKKRASRIKHPKNHKTNRAKADTPPVNPYITDKII